MIKSFGDPQLEKCWREGKCAKFSAELKHRMLMKLDSMDAATCIEDLRYPPGNRLHPLRGRLKGYWAMTVNGPWRLIFKFHAGDLYDVSLIQYH